MFEGFLYAQPSLNPSTASQWDFDPHFDLAIPEPFLLYFLANLWLIFCDIYSHCHVPSSTLGWASVFWQMVSHYPQAPSGEFLLETVMLCCPSPNAAKQSQTVTSCFTIGIRFFWWNTVFGFHQTWYWYYGQINHLCFICPEYIVPEILILPRLSWAAFPDSLCTQ